MAINGVKTGGREKGSRNKLTKQLQDWFEKDLIGADTKYQHPVLGLLAIGYNEEAPYAVRAKALEAASKTLVPTKIAECSETLRSFLKSVVAMRFFASRK